MFADRWGPARAFGLLLLLAGGAGCGHRSGYERYIPSEEAATRAVEAALAAWRDGQPPGRVESVAPPLQVVDTHRRPGQTLKDYEVLGLVRRDGPRCVAVRLVLDAPPEEQRVRYIVVGIDPLWVFRQEDYEMFSCMEHPTQPEDPKGTAAGDKPR